MKRIALPRNEQPVLPMGGSLGEKKNIYIYIYACKIYIYVYTHYRFTFAIFMGKLAVSFREGRHQVQLEPNWKWYTDGHSKHCNLEMKCSNAWNQ